MVKRKKSITKQQHIQRRTFVDFITKSFMCRDTWAGEVPDDQEGIRNKGYSQFKRWLMNAYSRPEPPRSAVEFIKLLVAPNDPAGYNTDTLKGLLDFRHNDRDYRVVVGADVSNGDQDFRVRNFMEALIDAKQNSNARSSSTMSAWVCPFFCTRQMMSSSRTKQTSYSTLPCSRFEQMLFLAAVAKLSFALSTRNSKKRLKGSNGESVPVVSLPSVKTLNGIVSQRLGYGIQQVVYGWDVFVQRLGFESVEEMVMPYSRINRSPVMFEVISDREMGFVPLSQRNTFAFDVSLTTLREETFADAFDRAPQLDKDIRVIVDTFFKDFYSVIMADALYGDGKWDYLESYADPGGMPSRFERLSQDLVASIASGMKSALRMRVARVGTEEDESPDVEIENDVAKLQDPGVSDELVGEEELRMHEAAVRKAMGRKWRMLACSFDDLLEAYEQLYPREELAGKVQFILSDPPYNIRRENGSKNASYDMLTFKQMNSVVDVFDMLLRPGGHGIVFCTVQQFPLWEQKFNKHSSGRFVVDKTPVVFAWHPAKYKSFAGRRSCVLQNCVEFAIHVKKTGLPFEQEQEMVNYQNFNYVGSDYAGHKNVISNIWGLQPGEQVRITGEGAARTAALRNEQKPLSVLKELICRFTQPGDIVGDLFGGTFSTLSACFSVERHRQFVGCEVDTDCFKHAQKHCVNLFAEVLVNGKSDIVVSDTVKHAASRIVLTAKGSKRRTDEKWMAPKGLPQYQALPNKMLSFLASKTKDPTFYFSYKGHGVHEWPRTSQGVLQETDPKVLRSIDAAALGVLVGRSKIKCSFAGLGVFAVKTFAPGDIIGPFYGTLVYHNLMKRKEVHKTYGEGIMGVTAKRFQAYAIQVPVRNVKFGMVRDLMDGKKAVSIVPAPFCVMGIANDYRYHPEDEEFGVVEGRRTANAEFVTEMTIKSPEQLVNPFVQVVRAKTFINPGDEIYMNYGNRYDDFVNNCGLM